MTTLREAAQQALKALELTSEKRDPMRIAAITALRAALAQPEHNHDCALLQIPSRECDCGAETAPEPVQHAHKWFRTGSMEPGQMRCIHCGMWGHNTSDKPLYTAPPQQPAPEPMACETEGDCTHMPWCKIRRKCQKMTQPAPPQRNPLTDEEIYRICNAHWSLRQLARAIERAHGIGR